MISTDFGLPKDFTRISRLFFTGFPGRVYRNSEVKCPSFKMGSIKLFEILLISLLACPVKHVIIIV